MLHNFDAEQIPEFQFLHEKHGAWAVARLNGNAWEIQIPWNPKGSASEARQRNGRASSNSCPCSTNTSLRTDYLVIMPWLLWQSQFWSKLILSYCSCFEKKKLGKDRIKMWSVRLNISSQIFISISHNKWFSMGRFLLIFIANGIKILGWKNVTMSWWGERLAEKTWV